MLTKDVAFRLLIVCISVFIRIDAVRFSSCDNSLSEVFQVNVEGCASTRRCVLKPNQKLAFSVRFTTIFQLVNSTTSASLRVSGSQLSLNRNAKVGCPDIPEACPKHNEDSGFTCTRVVKLPDNDHGIRGKLSTAADGAAGMAVRVGNSRKSLNRSAKVGCPDIPEVCPKSHDYEFTCTRMTELPKGKYTIRGELYGSWGGLVACADTKVHVN